MTPYPAISSNLEFHKVNGSDQYLLKFSGRVLYVSNLLHFIISELARKTPIDDLTKEINCSGRLSRRVSELDVCRMIEKHILPLELNDSSCRKSASSEKDIKHNVVLFRFEQIHWVLKYSRKLFAASVFFPLLAISILCTLYYLHTNVDSPLMADGGTWFHLAFFGIAFLLVLLHELGHASAAYYYGVMPKEIGIGMYFFVPVFYADVTDIWKLVPRQRIVVNLAGVFVQLVANVILLLVVSVTNSPPLKSLLHQLIVFNFLSVLANLNPFFKFDGYWVYADFFNLPTLQAASGAQLRRVWRALKKFNLPKDNAPWSLSLYTVGKIVFTAWICHQLYHMLPIFIAEVYEFVKTTAVVQLYDDVYFFKAARYLIGTVMLAYAFWRFTKFVIGTLTNKLVLLRKK